MVTDEEGRTAAGWFDSTLSEVHWERFPGEPEGFATPPPRQSVVGSAFDPTSNAFWWVSAGPGDPTKKSVTVTLHGPGRETRYRLTPDMFGAHLGDLRGSGPIEEILWSFPWRESRTPEVWIPYYTDHGLHLLPSGQARFGAPYPQWTEGLTEPSRFLKATTRLNICTNPRTASRQHLPPRTLKTCRPSGSLDRSAKVPENWRTSKDRIRGRLSIPTTGWSGSVRYLRPNERRRPGSRSGQ